MAGSKSNMDVYLRLHGQRKFAKEVEASGAELEAMGLKGAKSMAAFAKSAEKLKSFGKSWTHNVSLPIAGLGLIAGGAAAQFKRQMGLIATDAGGSVREVAKLEPMVLKMARTTQYSGTELAKAMFHAESAGYRYGKALKVVHEGAELATIGNSELESTVYGLVSAQKALHGGDSVAGVRKTAAELNTIVAHGDIRLEELVAGMGSGLIEKATQAGVSLRSVGSGLDIMTARGIPAQRSSYALGFIFSKLVPYTEKATEAFESLGIPQEKLSKLASGPGGWPAMIKYLASSMAGLSRGQKSIDLSQMFGGGRMDVAVLASLQHVGELEAKYKELNPNMREYTAHGRYNSEQPEIQLKQAWGSIQDDLVEIGGKLLPAVVPGVQKIAHFASDAAGAFSKLPTNVAAIGTAALIAIGPLSSMLGYLASGTGRFLVMANGLAKAGTRFNTSRAEGSGFTSSLSAAFGGTGASGALQAAKGFATVIGPAVAAAGIGRIVYSATEHDWAGVGAEAGGAIAGGLAAVMIGNPELAPLFAGIGSFAGSALKGLFTAAPQVSKLSSRTQALTGVMKSYRESIGEVKPAEEGLAKARRRHQGSAAEEIEADRKLHHALAIYGEGSRQANRAQLALWRTQKKVIRSGREEAEAHKMVGATLQLYRMRSVKAVGALKDTMAPQKRRIGLLRQENRQGRLNEEQLAGLVRLEGKYHKNKEDLTAAYAKAETVAGKPWAERLKSLTLLQAEYGRKGKGLVTRMGEVTEKMRTERVEGLETTQMYKNQARELGKLLGLYERVNRLGTFAPEERSEGNLGKTGPPPKPRSHKGQHRTGALPNARTSMLPAPWRVSLDAAGLGRAQGGDGRHVTIEVPVELDGREVTRTVAKWVSRESLKT